jgi:hypothetical protein
MNKNLKRLLIVATYVCAFTLIFNDWLFGIGVGTALGVALTDDKDE